MDRSIRLRGGMPGLHPKRSERVGVFRGQVAQRAGCFRIVDVAIQQEGVRINLKRAAQGHDGSQTGNSLTAFQAADELMAYAGTLGQLCLREMRLTAAGTNATADEPIIDQDVQT